MSDPSLPVSSSDSVHQLQHLISSSFAAGQLEKITLSKYKGSEANLEKILIRSVALKKQPMLSFVYQYQTRDITKNYSLDDALTEITQQLDAGFKQLNAKTLTHDYQLMISKKGKPLLSQQSHLQKPYSQQLSPQSSSLPSSSEHSHSDHTHSTHNRAKQRYVEQSRPFLQQLGVTDQQGQIIPAMSRKWKQINKFVEIFANAIAQTSLTQQDTMSVVDFGSGKGYLTFAVHDFIRQQLHKTAEVTGVELRDELVQFCNQVAQTVDATGMTFYQGDVRSFNPDKIDIMIALHACDTATDYALHTGIRLNAAVIMCAPCCHKEIRPQLKMPLLLQPMLQYGVHLGQQAEMLTDSLRALLLEAHGYDTKVFEFVALEHTSKNKMILAIKKQLNAKKQAEVSQKIQELKQFYGIEQQSLEQLLGESNT
ncbi:MAG: SAM-dependent methyltransferase [Moraxellaceae bacterium]|nr:MAG: SAM-dependent methyltransferase [Moraxellaceae bacterium]